MTLFDNTLLQDGSCEASHGISLSLALALALALALFQSRSRISRVKIHGKKLSETEILDRDWTLLVSKEDSGSIDTWTLTRDGMFGVKVMRWLTAIEAGQRRFSVEPHANSKQEQPT